MILLVIMCLLYILAIGAGIMGSLGVQVYIEINQFQNFNFELGVVSYEEEINDLEYYQVVSFGLVFVCFVFVFHKIR